MLYFCIIFIFLTLFFLRDYIVIFLFLSSLCFFRFISLPLSCYPYLILSQGIICFSFLSLSVFYLGFIPSPFILLVFSLLLFALLLYPSLPSLFGFYLMHLSFSFVFYLVLLIFISGIYPSIVILFVSYFILRDSILGFYPFMVSPFSFITISSSILWTLPFPSIIFGFRIILYLYLPWFSQ